MRLYIAGPMRGYPRFNFDRFEEVFNLLRARGHIVQSPHRFDLEIGFEPDRSLLANHFDLNAAVRRDVEAIIWSQAVVMLEGWENSVGASAERSVALWLGRQVYLLEDFLLETETQL